jgi:septum formation protein
MILASASPRRKELLSWAGIEFETLAVDVDETPGLGEPPEACAARLAETKALAGARLFPHHWVLGADTIVTLDGVVLGKPRDRVDARWMLETLSGRVHQVVTAYCLAWEAGSGLHSGRGKTDVCFRPLSSRDVDAYIDSGEVWDKAGAYAIQGQGGALVDWLRGSYTNVVGLPLAEILVLFRKVGLLPKAEHRFNGSMA